MFLFADNMGCELFHAKMNQEVQIYPRNALLLHNMLQLTKLNILSKRYQNIGAASGTISLGRIGSDAPLLLFRDTTSTVLTDTPFVGFEVEQGYPIEFGVLCFEDDN